MGGSEEMRGGALRGREVGGVGDEKMRELREEKWEGEGMRR